MKRGFSLVELSIVLVILGLLTGGILAGQSLIRASELRAVTTEAQRYITVTQAFRDKYFSIPGDFRDATRFWTRMNSNADCVTNSSASVGTPGACDGNGANGIQSAGAGLVAAEAQQFWRHLALAGLIEGSYTGIAGSGGAWHCTIGSSCPGSKLNAGGWGVDTLNTYGGDSAWFSGSYGNNFVFGAQTATEYPSAAVLRPEEAWNIDTKMDDGKPGQGRVFAVRYSTCTNATGATDTGATYKLTDGSIACAMSFNNAF